MNKAAAIARNMVARFGMHEKLGLVTYETPRQTFLGEDVLAHFAEREFSEETAREIDCAVRELTTAAFEKASAILRKCRSQLDQGAKAAPRKGDAHVRGAAPAGDSSASSRRGDQRDGLGTTLERSRSSVASLASPAATIARTKTR